MTEEGRNAVDIRMCPECGNWIGFYATEGEVAIHPDPNRRVRSDKWNLMRIDDAGITCLKCNALVLAAYKIPGAVSTK